MATRTSHAHWEGTLHKGNGTVELGSGLFKGPYTFASRFESADGTNPEELIGAAHAGCFSQYLALLLEKEGLDPEAIDTDAHVTVEQVDGQPTITSSKLTVKAKVPGLDREAFARHAEAAKKGCPVSKALAGTEITLDAELVS
jgi:osmotically inducible protein OsmC